MQCEYNCYEVMTTDNIIIIIFLGKCIFVIVVWPGERPFWKQLHIFIAMDDVCQQREIQLELRLFNCSAQEENINVTQLWPSCFHIAIVVWQNQTSKLWSGCQDTIWPLDFYCVTIFCPVWDVLRPVLRHWLKGCFVFLFGVLVDH